MKSRFLFVALLVALVACLSVGSAFAADLEQSDVSDVIVDDVSVSVDNDADVSSVSANSGSWNDLQKKVDNTPAGGTLDLDSNYSYNLVTDNDDGVSITKDITINGNGFTLDGKNLARIFNISGSTVTINNLNFINGYEMGSWDYSGGAIFANYSDLTVDNCTFENNNASYGGAIYCYGNENVLNILNSIFISNYAFDGSGGAVYSDYDDCNIINSSFVNNHISADWGIGGAVSTSGDNGCIIDSCLFNNNSSPSTGGAVNCYHNEFILNNSLFMNNVAGSEGGALYFLSGSYRLIYNSSFINNSAYWGAGAIYTDDNNDCYFNVSNCIFDGNTVDGEINSIDIDNRLDFYLDNNYWAMNFTTADEFLNSNLIEYYDDYVPFWVLMSVTGNQDTRTGYNESYTIKFDKVTNGTTISAFDGVLPIYLASVYVFNSASEPNYNHEWTKENPSVGEYIDDVVVSNCVGTFNFIPGEDTYYFRAFSSITNWEESVLGPVKATIPIADLSIKVVADKSKYNVGDEIIYTITVVNKGPDKALDTIVNDILQNNVKFISAKASKGVFEYDVGLWTIGTLDKGESVTLTIAVVAKEKGTVVNEVAVSSSSLDPNPESDIDNVSVNVDKKQKKPDPKPNPNPNPNPKPTPKPTPSKGVANTLPNTGNPLALVVLSLLTIALGGFKRKL